MKELANVKQAVFIDPSYDAYYRNKLFDIDDAYLNRDDCLSPFRRLRDELNARGVQVDTADLLLDGKEAGAPCQYYSLGLLANYQQLAERQNVHLGGFIIFEPPVVAPKLYRALPQLTAAFERVYVHNTTGDGYSLKGVDQSRLRQLYWPQPYRNVLTSYWENTDRQNRIVVINGNHIPRSFRGELYSRRIETMAALARSGAVDLYGRGWDKWWSLRSMWPPYWRNYKTLMSIYRGACESKYEVLSRYRFSLCFENMTMRGYVTEKIFDCLYAGAIPLYLGAPDIGELIPAEAYVDCRRFASWEQMWHEVSRMSEDEVKAMRLAGREFIEGAGGRRYYDSLIGIFSDR